MILKHLVRLNILKEERYLVYLLRRAIFMRENLFFVEAFNSDRLARKDNVKLDVRIVGFRGDYYDLTDKAKRKFVI